MIQSPSPYHLLLSLSTSINTKYSAGTNSSQQRSDQKPEGLLLEVGAFQKEWHYLDSLIQKYWHQY